MHNMEPRQDTAKVAQIILFAVHSVQLGKHRLAGFLKGSKSKEVLPLIQKNGFGGLLWHDLSTIEGFIEQLEQSGFIRRLHIDTFLSYYVLTDNGKKAVNETITIPLHIIKKYKPLTIGNSERATLSLMRQGKTIPEVAHIRGLAGSTIYTHAYRLILGGELRCSDVVPQEIYEKIKDVCSTYEKQPSAKDIKEQLPEQSYEHIRCVIAEIFKRERVEKML